MVRLIKRYFKRIHTKREDAYRCKVRDVLFLIKEYYIDKSMEANRSLHESFSSVMSKAREKILSLGVVKVDLVRNKVIITLQRPGLLIGMCGANITALQDFLSKKLHYKVEIIIKEEKMLQFLIPEVYDETQDY